MTRVVTTLDRAAERLSTGGVMVACVWMGAIVLIIVADVVGRATGAYSIVGAPEIATQSVVGITFLCVPYAMRRRVHMRSTILLDRMPAPTRQAVVVGAYAAGALVFLAIAGAAWEPMVRSWSLGEYSGEGALRVPIYPLRTLVLLTSVLMAIECLLAATRVVTGAEDDHATGEDAETAAVGS